jgi:hypothetical protein
LLADISIHLGHPADGLQALAEAHTLVEQQEEHLWEAEVYRLRGVLLLKAEGGVRKVAKPFPATVWAERVFELPTADAVAESAGCGMKSY